MNLNEISTLQIDAQYMGLSLGNMSIYWGRYSSCCCQETSSLLPMHFKAK